MLINLQPYGRPMNLEVRFGDQRSPAGVARDNPDKLGDMRESLRTVAELATAGLFSLRHEAAWQFEIHFPSPADWKEFLDKPTCGGVEADSELLDAALSQPDGSIVLTEENLTLVHERLEP